LLQREDVTVASVAGQMAGVMATYQPGGISWITQLYLHPSHVAQGIGSQLLNMALATLPRPIRLYTFQQNTGARRFYERNGFLPIQFTDGAGNDERCPDVLYELAT
jgi:GNAT superfamily N-acetyltransferase